MLETYTDCDHCYTWGKEVENGRCQVRISNRDMVISYEDPRNPGIPQVWKGKREGRYVAGKGKFILINERTQGKAIMFYEPSECTIEGTYEEQGYDGTWSIIL